ncbi:MAG TPA: pseudouridine synthase [Puia sp.]|nr:pseudouridine synthase [Puia sp.]
MKKNSPSGERPSLGKRKTDNFSKFYNKKRNSAIKEALRQEKKAAKKDREQAIERHFEERRLARTQQPAPGKPAPRRPAPLPSKPAPAKPAPRKPTPLVPKPSPTGKPPAPTRGVAATKPTHNPRAAAPNPATPTETLPLNKYIAHGGICSRRDAAELVRQGKVTVNGQLITEPGTKVHPTDTVKVSNRKVTISNNYVYILLNKPKDYITTTEDPQGRRTVLDLIRPATAERVFPIGRLDRNTSGVLLFTNDGDLAQKLAHPSHQIKKIYHVTLDKPLTKADFDKIASGTVTLEDGPAPVDDLAYADPKDKAQIGIEIHSGRNRIVRRIFEHLGYDVRGLDRVMYAGLTKKNVQRGHWRLLTEKEIRILKYLNSSIKGSPGRAKDIAAPNQPGPALTPNQPAPAPTPNQPAPTPAPRKTKP